MLPEYDGFMTDLQVTSKLQIQPQFSHRREWETIASEEGLLYEALEFSAPAAPGEDVPQDEKKAWYRESGRAFSVHGAFMGIDPACGDGQLRVLSRKRCLESCRLAGELGARNVVFHSSCGSFLRGPYMDSWASQCAAWYEELAETCDLNIWIENSQDVDAGPIRELMKGISDPRIGVCLDLGHVNYSRMPMAQWFEELGAWIGYLHLSDNNGLFDDHLPLGDGSVDWEAADSFRRSLQRSVTMTLEVGGTEGVRKSVQYLKEHGLFGMG